MSNQTKLRTVHENNMKGIVGMTKSRIYNDTHDLIGALEDVQFSSDVKIAQPITGNQTNIVIPNTYRLIKHMWLRVVMKAKALKTTAVPDPFHWTGPEAYWLTKQVQRLRIKIPGVEQMDFNWSDMVNFLQDCEENVGKRNAYRKLNGDSFTALREKDELFLLFPLLWCGVKGGMDSAKPFPNHMLAEPMMITIDWTDTSIFNSIDFHFQYGDLSSGDNYKKAIYSYPYKQLYPYVWSADSPSMAITWVPQGVSPNYLFSGKAKEILSNDLRTVNMLGLRPGDCSQIYFRVVQTGLAPDSLVFTSTAATVLKLNYFQRDRNYLSTDVNRGNKFGVRIRDLKILYNGQIIYFAEGDNQKILTLVTHSKESHQIQDLHQPDQVFAPLANRAPAGNVTYAQRGPLGVDSITRTRNSNAPWTGTTGYNNFTALVGVLQCEGVALNDVAGVRNISTYHYSAPTANYEIVSLTSRDTAVDVTEIVKWDGIFGAAPSTTLNSKFYAFAPHQYRDYVYKINFSELANEYQKNYGPGIDFAFTQPQITFRIDSDDSDDLCALAQNCGAYQVICSQSLQSCLKFKDGGVVLIQ